MADLSEGRTRRFPLPPLLVGCQRAAFTMEAQAAEAEAAQAASAAETTQSPEPLTTQMIDLHPDSFDCGPAPRTPPAKRRWTDDSQEQEILTPPGLKRLSRSSQRSWHLSKLAKLSSPVAKASTSTAAASTAVAGNVLDVEMLCSTSDAQSTTVQFQEFPEDILQYRLLNPASCHETRAAKACLETA